VETPQPSCFAKRLGEEATTVGKIQDSQMRLRACQVASIETGSV